MLQKIVVVEASVVSEGWRINLVFETGVTNLWLLAKRHRTPNSDTKVIIEFCSNSHEVKVLASLSLQLFSMGRVRDSSLKPMGTLWGTYDGECL